MAVTLRRGERVLSPETQAATARRLVSSLLARRLGVGARPRRRSGGRSPAGRRPGRRGARTAAPKQCRRGWGRCHRCQTKLELVQQELGSCRCGYVFCLLHRLPEQHDCLFDHLGRGREEAVMKMVKLDRKVGRSCQRIGEECS
ncbi:hypothetical protein ANANG_G00024720 [Anguilla anguilla]|uniref:AN1-type domain-containing protein n=1 Tax=Anguilla anguilla TaxID=7936 RepID=A0A9D3S6Y7_ANGAN|nr:hypothetical protein ANANG_G00024720 [Anguilla anguilla]